MSNISKRRREGSRAKIKSVGDHDEFLKRITKTLYYGQLPSLPCLSLPVTEVSCSLWSEWQRGRSLRRLHVDAAAGVARRACVSPCALVLAILYLERLNNCNPEYLTAAQPADLFLVSLMVGNKFLQDDGEDDEVICSEWAASGGIELKQLKKLELEFLNAIDWKVFVSEKSFEDRLLWLERQVALKQSQLRGFFTYTDLCVTGDGALVGELARGLAQAWLMVALAYFASALAFLTSALLVSRVCLPAWHHVNTSPTLNTDLAPTLQSDSIPYISNATTELPTVYTQFPEELSDKLKCCTLWSRYRDNVDMKKNRHDAVVNYDWKLLEPWWSRTSVLNWLYQSSVIDPMQRWLEKINEYADLFKYELKSVRVEPSRRIERCHDHLRYNGELRCIRQWLNLSKLNSIVVSVSDR